MKISVFLALTFFSFLMSELIRCYWLQRPDGWHHRVIAAAITSASVTVVLAAIDWLVGVREVTLVTMCFLLYATLSMGYKKRVVRKVPSKGRGPIDKTTLIRNVIVAILGVLNLIGFLALQFLFPANAAWNFGAFLNFIMIGRFLYKGYKKAKPVAVLGVTAFLVIYALLPRSGPPSPVDILFMVFTGAGCFLFIGVLNSDRLAQSIFIFYELIYLAAIFRFTLQSLGELDSIRKGLSFSLGSLHLGALLLTTIVMFRQIASQEGFHQWSKSILKSLAEPFRGLQKIEWFGILVIVIAAISAFVDSPMLDKYVGSLYRIFIGIFQNVIEPAPRIIFEELFFLFGFHAPAWFVPAFLIFGFLLRIAHLHSQRYADTTLWVVIMERIRGLDQFEDSSVSSRAGFSTNEVTMGVIILNFMIMATLLSVAGWNPIRTLAPDGGVTILSALAVGVAGYLLGAVAKELHYLHDRLDGRTGLIFNYILLIMRIGFFGPALVIISPLIAWRTLFASLIIGVVLLLLSSGVDLIRPEL